MLESIMWILYVIFGIGYLSICFVAVYITNFNKVWQRIIVLLCSILFTPILVVMVVLLVKIINEYIKKRL
jgi:hypothetical protein